MSRSTVSYALSGKRPLSEETRRRIHDVIDELGYRPNAHARALKEGRTRTIGLVIPPAGLRLTDMQVDFVAGIVDAAARSDLDVLISSSGGDHDRSFERVVTGRLPMNEAESGFERLTSGATEDMKILISMNGDAGITDYEGGR